MPRLKVPGRNADNVAAKRKKGIRARRSPNEVLQRDNAAGTMDYVKSRGHRAGTCNKVHTNRNSERGPRLADAGSAATADPMSSKAGELHGIRWRIHCLAGRLATARETVASIERALARLKEQELDAVRSLFWDSPATLADVNDSTRRWRR